jgi:hypothetical protein
MTTETKFTTERLDRLGIAAGTCQEIGLIEEINQQIGPSEQKMSYGEGVQAMVPSPRLPMIANCIP